MKDVSMKNKLLSHIAWLAMVSFCCVCHQVYAQDQSVSDVATRAMQAETVPVDFPARESLSVMQEAMLPTSTDNTIKEPGAMPINPSKKAGPSEQLLGRISSDVFYEMADLERGNVFLKLQSQREQLKNDLEELKAKYRQSRLEEIEKREAVIRTRVEWMQQQEDLRQEILDKRAKTESLDQEIAAQEARKESLLAGNPTPTKDFIEPEETVDSSVLSELMILDIKGVKGKLTARLYGSDGKVFAVKTGQKMPFGAVVKSINKDSVVFVTNGVEASIEITPTMIIHPESESTEDDVATETEDQSAE